MNSITDNPKFGPNAQTPAQRAYILQQLKATNPELVRNATSYTHQLYSRYVAGELSWNEVCELRDAQPVPTYLGAYNKLDDNC